jgi:hypothetical protein
MTKKRDANDLETYMVGVTPADDPEKKIKKDEQKPVNILDKLAGDSNPLKSKTGLTAARDSLFHKKGTGMEDATSLFFKNCRFGIR